MLDNKLNITIAEKIIRSIWVDRDKESYTFSYSKE